MVVGTPGPERTERAPRFPCRRWSTWRPVHIPKLFLRPLSLAIQVHAFRLRPPLYDVAVVLAPVLVGRGMFAPDPSPGAFGHAPKGRADLIQGGRATRSSRRLMRSSRLMLPPSRLRSRCEPQERRGAPRSRLAHLRSCSIARMMVFESCVMTAATPGPNSGRGNGNS